MDANTLTLIEAALDERERAEAAMTAGIWLLEYDGIIRADYIIAVAAMSHAAGPFRNRGPDANGTGIALLRNAAPADNELHRALFELAKELDKRSELQICAHCSHSKDSHRSVYLDCPDESRGPGRRPSPRSTRYAGKSIRTGQSHDAAEQIIALLAQALLPVADVAQGNTEEHGDES